MTTTLIVTGIPTCISFTPSSNDSTVLAQFKPAKPSSQKHCPPKQTPCILHLSVQDSISNYLYCNQCSMAKSQSGGTRSLFLVLRFLTKLASGSSSLTNPNIIATGSCIVVLSSKFSAASSYPSTTSLNSSLLTSISLSSVCLFYKSLSTGIRLSPSSSSDFSSTVIFPIKSPLEYLTSDVITLLFYSFSLIKG